jgi:ATP-independent RNA helicase DbpA
MYFAAGKKDKLNKVDLVGFLMQKGKLNKDDIGRIDVLDHQSFVAIKKDALPKLLPRIESEKIKNRKIKMGLTEA